MRLRTVARHWIRSAWWRLVGTRRVRTEIARRQSADYVPLEAIQAWEERQPKHIAAVVQINDARRGHLTSVRIRREG